MSPEERVAILTLQTTRGIDLWRADWRMFAHPHQREPDLSQSGAAWTTWLVLGGRGAGKTRLGAEWVRGLVYDENARLRDTRGQIALVGETEHDAREVMVEGVSGLLAVHPRHQRPAWIPTRKRLEWPNGAVAQLFSAEDPDSLRGPQFSAAWCDEIAKWKYADEEQPINQWRSPREPLDSFAVFEGFGR